MDWLVRTLLLEKELDSGIEIFGTTLCIMRECQPRLAIKKLVPLFQNEFSYKTFYIKLSLTCMKIYLWADNNSYWPLDWLQLLPVQQIWRSCTRRSRLFSFPQTWSSDVAIAGSCYPHSSRWPQGRSGHLSSISLRVAGLHSHSDTFSVNRSDSSVRVCLKHNTLSRCFRWFCHRQITLKIAWNQSVQPLKSQEWSNSNFSIQYRYIIRQTDED